MHYINLIIFSALLSSCATTNTSRLSESVSSGKIPLEQSESELTQYKQALTMLDDGKLDAAKDIFIEFIDERPELAGPYANLAVIAIRQNKPNEAFKLVTTAVQRNPKLPQALNLLAYLEQVTGEIKSAEKHYKEAIKYKSNYALAHYNLALLYDIYLQDINSAIPHYEKYMTLIGNKDKNTADWLEQLKRTKENG
jgi:tetratricopeptide (TPR) repeat protein